MLVILGSRAEPITRGLVERWAGHGAVLVTCGDLSKPGWRFDPGAPLASTAVVDGRRVAAREITGWLTRLPAVFARELSAITPGDRDYVASEMTAFLLAWLAALPCRVLNRPTPGCLSGPAWSPARWALAAARAGLRVNPQPRTLAPELPSAAPQVPSPAATVTIVGLRTLGDVDSALARGARRLADTAGVALLSVHFDGQDAGAAFVGVNPWPDLRDPELADAALACLRSEPC